MKLEYKNRQVFDECCVEWHPKLVNIVAECYYCGGYELIITSGYRPKGSGVHSVIPLRAIDIRSWSTVTRNIVGWINRRWIYDPERPHMKCALLHDAGFGEHIHIQVHPNTRRVIR